MFPKVNPKQSFPALEEEVLKFWKENDTFKKSVENRPAEKPYRFYDGPPFITGTPHYGSLLSSIVKDIVPRYHTMQGKRVERVWGWDCHGLPIEEKVQKKLGLAGSKDIEEKVGIETFIEECYKYTKETSAEWDWYIDHIGRWVDMGNAYKTMDQNYMESVMWVFKSMWEKGMIYKGQRVSLYSWKLSTPISNFEVAMDDSYQEVSDPAITVMFPLQETGLEERPVSAGDFLLAWTTTPWTIPAHMAIAVNSTLAYSRVLSEGKYFILATARVEHVFKGREFEIVETFLGKELLGLSYEAPFSYYQGRVDASKNHIILDADFVTDTDGTGIAHEAPEFGDVDFQLAKKNGVHISAALDNEGKYTDEISDYIGLHYQEANDVISAKLKEMGRLFKKESINHRVAMCPRSGTPLIYKAQDSWFINIQDLKSRLIAENEGINWQPNHLKHGQFLKSMEGAPDWCISRTRYWGTPMPIWAGEKDEKLVVGSKQEIFELNKPFGQLTKVILVRHGRTDYNIARKVDIIGKAELVDMGLTHAENIKKWLENKQIDAIYCSPLKRCQDTIAPLSTAKNIAIQTSDDIIELQVLSSQEQHTDYLDERVFENCALEAGDETIAELLTRTKRFLQKVVSENPGKTIVICSHFYTSAALYHALHNFDWDTEHTKYALTNKLERSDYVPFKSEYIFSETGKPLNLHRPYIDVVKLQSPTTGNTLTRIPEVLDVWMDSGSMPYAQMHYPFEKQAEMVASYPADFIVEYIGQVRAWFYVMHVVGVALFDKRSFTNVITTGIVNGNDGRKMSKSYGNYPDPRKTIETYGADAIRFYMANSPLLTGGNMDFKEEGIVEVIKKVILPLWNTYSFFTTYANIDGFEKPHPTSPYQGEEQAATSSLLTKEGLEGGKSNPLDTWILSETHKLIDDVVNGMEKYEVTEATRPIVKFMDNLTNWYIRRSRKRFWKSENDGDKMQAYETLYEVLVTLCKVMAPFTPFITEHIYKNLTGEESLHLTDFPIANLGLVDMKLNADMDLVQKIINLGLGLRTRAKIRVRQPLLSISIGQELSDYYKEILKEELNVKEVLTVDANSIAQKICKPDGRRIGPKFGAAVKDIISEAKAGNFTELGDGRVQVGEYILEAEDFEIAFITTENVDNVESGFGMAISINLEITPELELEGYARDLVRQIQESRKEANYNVDDRIAINIKTENLEAIFASYDICSETLSHFDSTLLNGDLVKEIEIGDGKIATIILKK